MLGIIKALNASALPTNYKFEGTPKRTTFAAKFKITNEKQNGLWLQNLKNPKKLLFARLQRNT
jgi:hypothetical protein